ncbi:MAG: MT-A70 family methyltransferase [Fimbriimonadaceae bacterium]
MGKRPRFQLALIDPPWFYYGDPNKNAAAGKHYPLMSQEELAALPVRQILTRRAAVFLWATGPRLDMAIDLLRAWGLHYRGVAYVWVKTNAKGEPIRGQGIPPTFTKPTTEFLLAATTIVRGRPLPVHDMAQGQVVLHARGRHSEKPAVFHGLLEELLGDVSRVELFARHQRPGWTCLGEEIDGRSIQDTLAEIAGKPRVRKL